MLQLGRIIFVTAQYTPTGMLVKPLVEPSARQINASTMITAIITKTMKTSVLRRDAGYTSTVSDLAKFASWQFRLLKNGGNEILRAATLRDMQRVQWTDPDGKVTWGLGFGVSYSGTTKIVGLTGLCPGYLSAISMVPKEELAVIVMTNNQVSIGDYSRPMRAILEKGCSLPAQATGKDAPDLNAYAGIYSYRNRGGEQAIVPWGKGLAVVSLPSRDPAASLDLLRHIQGDKFRFVRDDGSLGQELTFKRNAEGKIVGHELEWHISGRLRALPQGSHQLNVTALASTSSFPKSARGFVATGVGLIRPMQYAATDSFFNCFERIIVNSFTCRGDLLSEKCFSNAQRSRAL